METGDAGDITAAARQIEYAETAKAVSHGRDPGGIHLGLLAQHVNRQANARLQQGTVLHQRGHQRGVFLGRTAQHTLAVHIDGKAHIPLARQRYRLPLLEGAAPGPGRGDGHGGPGCADGIIPGQETLENKIVVPVFDQPRLNCHFFATAAFISIMW